MKAVVMAGGEGSRLRPLTSNRPKPLVPIGNRPIMEHILYLLKRHQVTEVVSTLYYLADEIQSYFGDGSDFGVSMTYSIETRPLGTAGSVKLAEDQLRSETFIIISGDALTDCDLTAAIEFHKAKGSLATLVLARVPNPLDFGVVITDEESRITRFLEKPGWSEVFSDTVNTGIYILEPAVFDLMDANRSYDWSSDIFPKILEAGQPIFGYVMDGYWADVGSLTQYREANEDYLQHKVKLPSVAPADEQHNEYGPNVSIDDRAKIIAPVALGRNVKIKRGAQIGPYTVIGDNTVVEEDALIERSVLWDSVYVGPNVAIHSAMLGSRSIIKKDSVIREDAVIGDRCLIDVGGNIRPRIKIWPDKIVERGSTVTMSLVWGNKWRGNLFRELGVAGLSNIEITPDFACRLGSAFGSCFNPGSRIVTSRDSTRSSRMIKRAIIASLLSVGLDVLDMRSAALPVARHFIRASGAVGAVNVRKLPGNSRVTLIEMFDSEGAYLSRSLERKVESLFYREDFKRTDPDDLGTMEFASRAVEEYQNDYFRALGEGTALRRMRIVCDYGYSSLASIFPAMLERLGVESISINSFNDAKLAPRSDADVERHVQNLRHIVGTLSYDMGVLFTDEGERLVLVDGHGEHIEGPRLLGVVGTLVAMTSPGAEVAMSVSAPTSLEDSLIAHGAKVIRTKDDVRSLMASSLERRVAVAGDQRGGFIFPDLHPGFDAPFALGRLISMLQKTGLSLTEVAASLPTFNVAYEQVKVPWEHKGLVMRRLSEEVGRGSHVELLDGIKVFSDHSWVLVLPDSLEPTFHLYAESESQSHSNALINEYSVKIQAILPEASRNG